jgi:hypothetical protein
VPANLFVLKFVPGLVITIVLEVVLEDVILPVRLDAEEMFAVLPVQRRVIMLVGLVAKQIVLKAAIILVEMAVVVLVKVIIDKTTLKNFIIYKAYLNITTLSSAGWYYENFYG